MAGRLIHNGRLLAAKHRESAFLAAVFLLQLGYSGGGGFQLNLQHRDRRLLLGKVARDDKRQNF